MKKILYWGPALLVVVFSSVSCGKKGGSTSTCEIITINDAPDNAVFNLTYDNDGRISTQQEVSAGVTTSKVFTYSGDVTMVSTTSPTSSSTDSIVVGSNGLISIDVNINGTNRTEATYTYSGSQLQKIVNQVNWGTPSTGLFTFTNGDLTSEVQGANTTTYTYYTDKSSAPGDYLQLVQLVNYGQTFIKSQHLISGYSVNGTIEGNFSYTYDSKGNIASIIFTGGSTSGTLSYQYQCN